MVVALGVAVPACLKLWWRNLLGTVEPELNVMLLRLRLGATFVTRGLP